MIIQRIQNICATRAISVKEVLDLAGAIADVAHQNGTHVLTELGNHGSYTFLKHENAQLKKQIAILEDGIDETAAELVDGFLEENEEACNGSIGHIVTLENPNKCIECNKKLNTGDKDE